jgi:hypothetical protein
MKIRRILLLFVILSLLGSTIWFSYFIFSQTDINQSIEYTTNNAVVEFNNFSSFQILYDEPGLSSTKTDAHLNFTYNGGSTGFHLMRYYYLNLSDYGNFFDFDLQITVDYNYTGSISFGGFEFIAGSYYDEFSAYCGEPTGIVGGNPCAPAKPLCKCNVVDAWTDFGSEFRVHCCPFDICEKEITTHGVPGIVGTATFSMSRFNNVIYCQVKQSNSIMVDNVWFYGVTKPLNFILIGEGIYAEDTNFASASFYDFTALLNHSNIRTIYDIETITETETEYNTTTETITVTAGILFSVFLVSTLTVFTIVLIRRRRK